MPVIVEQRPRGFYCGSPLDTLIVVPLGLEDLFDGDWLDVFCFGLGQVDFRWWVLPLNTAHHNLGFLVLVFTDDYFSYKIMNFGIANYVLPSFEIVKVSTPN